MRNRTFSAISIVVALMVADWPLRLDTTLLSAAVGNPGLQFSFIDAATVFGAHNGPGANLRTIAAYDFARKTCRRTE